MGMLLTVCQDDAGNVYVKGPLGFWPFPLARLFFDLTKREVRRCEPGEI